MKHCFPCPGIAIDVFNNRQPSTRTTKGSPKHRLELVILSIMSSRVIVENCDHKNSFFRKKVLHFPQKRAPLLRPPAPRMLCLRSTVCFRPRWQFLIQRTLKFVVKRRKEKVPGLTTFCHKADWT